MSLCPSPCPKSRIRTRVSAELRSMFHDHYLILGGNLNGRVTNSAFKLDRAINFTQLGERTNNEPHLTAVSETKLQEARQNHESIAVGSTVVHIGGSGLRHTERWDMDPNGDVKITLSGAPPFNSWESKPYTFPPHS